MSQRDTDLAEFLRTHSASNTAALRMAWLAGWNARKMAEYKACLGLEQHNPYAAIPPVAYFRYVKFFDRTSCTQMSAEFYEVWKHRAWEFPGYPL